MSRLRHLCVLALCLTGFFAAGPAAAAGTNRADAFTLSPMAGGQFFEGNQDLDDDWTFGLGFGYNYNERCGSELFFSWTDTQTFRRGTDIYNMMVNGIFHLLPGRSLVPYFTLGAGAQTRNEGSSETDFLLNYGFGLKWFWTDAVALRADARHLLALDQGIDEISKGHDNLLLTAGLTFQFGYPEAAPAPAPVAQAEPAPAPARPAPAPAPARAGDSDQDGIADDRDQCPDTERGVMVDAKGCPISMEIHVEFDFDKAEIKPEFHDELQRAADFIKENPAPYILIAGHTDDTGTDEYNKELSDRRSAAVRQFLIREHGIDGAKLVSRGYGESRPVASNETPEGRQANRRTEIVCCVFIPQ